MPSYKNLSKRVKNLFCPKMKENVFFLHIPKCGGTSVRRAIRMSYQTLDFRKDRCLVGLNATASSEVMRMTNSTNYPKDGSTDYDLLKLREKLLLYYMNQKDTKLIMGHVTFSDVVYCNFYEQYAFVTILRDPMKRWISTYFYNRFKESEHFKLDMEIEDYIESEFGKSQGCEYVKFLGGPRYSEDYSSSDAISNAKSNLHKFRIVGILEEMDVFKNKYQDEFGVSLNIEVVNKNPKTETTKNKIITPKIEARIRDICRSDYEIYQYAIENFTTGV